ncbi:MAG TPA: GNAT family N-acetyltransferase [Pirellulales bacterium]|nr:GNAT family N-acetyltransferase [Pirellulales bacterium]
MNDPLTVEKLRSDHVVSDFECPDQQLNRFLARFALVNQQAGAAQTYVAVSGNSVVGYYSLAVGQVAFDDAPRRLSKGLARHPVPIILLARLAVSTVWQGRGLGSGLLKDAMRRTLQAADIAGIRALMVHAKDETARRFYEHFGFIPSVTDPMHLFLLLKDIRRVASV